ncbi:MAG: 50S ribosomal protein L3 [Nanoarchaeota archaeon]|nr:50S ribosomal protein L3 [Nanoarchaeota archaeon]
MGHQITKKHTPRRGSLQYWPIRKAKRSYNTFHSFSSLEPEEIGIAAGYKVGMVNALYIDSDKDSPTFKTEIMSAATILECPPLLIVAARFYKNNQVIGEVWGKEIDKNVTRKVKFKPENAKWDDLSKEADDVRLLVSTQPWLIGLKKKPEIFETPIGGDIGKKLSKASELLGQKIEISSIIKEGEFVDVSGVTKGKGFSSAVKRYGVALFPAKASKSRRKAGNLGAESMAKVQFTVPQHGRLGFNSRVEYNKYVLKIFKDVKELNPKGGFRNYGELKTTSLLIKGSVMGPPGRLILLRKAIRPVKKGEPTRVTAVV